MGLYPKGSIYIAKKNRALYKEARFFFLLFFPSITVKCAVLLLRLCLLAFKEEDLVECCCCPAGTFSLVCSRFFDFFAAFRKALCSLFCGLVVLKWRKMNQIIAPTATMTAMFRKNPAGFFIKLVVKPMKARRKILPNKIIENRFFKKPPP